MTTCRYCNDKNAQVLYMNLLLHNNKDYRVPVNKVIKDSYSVQDPDYCRSIWCSGEAQTVCTTDYYCWLLLLLYNKITRTRVGRLHGRVGIYTRYPFGTPVRNTIYTRTRRFLSKIRVPIYYPRIPRFCRCPSRFEYVRPSVWVVCWLARRSSAWQCGVCVRRWAVMGWNGRRYKVRTQA